MRDILIPGDMVASEPLRMENTYVENGKTFAKVLGMYEREKKTLVPLEGVWIPKIGDIVVGIITGTKNTVYEVDLNFFGRSILIGSKYERQSYKNGDVVEAIVKDVEDRKTVILSGPKILYGGTVLNIKPIKVPRVIGKNNTMIGQIADLTGCNMIVGKNGTVWLKGEGVGVATEAIRQIEAEAHISGLTERIKRMLEEKCGPRRPRTQETEGAEEKFE